MSKDNPDGSGADGARAAVPSSPPSGPGAEPVSSAHLMQGRREIVILHAGEPYRLRITANDKLILTK